MLIKSCCVWVPLSSFKLFLELEPQIRDIIFKFYESKYASCLKLLDEMKVRSHTRLWFHVVHNLSQIVPRLSSARWNAPLSSWVFPTSGGELFFDNDRCYGKSRLSYHSTSSPVTYPPQHPRLLSDVNVSGGLFLNTL